MKRAAFWSCTVVCIACRAAPALADTQWQASWSHIADDGHVAGGSASAREPRSNVLALARSSQAGPSLVARHRYDILDLPAIDSQAAATNGHVHRLSAGIEWNDVSNDGRTRLRIEPTLAVSSNVGRHPKAARASDVLPVAQIERTLAGAAGDAALRAGVAADARLGRLLVYPTVRWGDDEAGRSHWQIGFPESRWRQAIGSSASIELGVEPDGWQWQVRDRELTRRSRVRLELWRAAATLRWEFGEHVAVALVAGRTFAGELRYELVDGTAVTVDLPGGTFAAAQVHGRW